MTGGDIRLCTFITYTQLGVALISFGMACYYCARSVQDETRRARAARPKGGLRYSPAIRLVTQLGVALVSFGMACYYCARSVQDDTGRARAAHLKGKGHRYSPEIRLVKISIFMCFLNVGYSFQKSTNQIIHYGTFIDISFSFREGKNLDPCLTPIALTSALISILLLCVAYMYTEGYYKTCSQYRRTIARNLKVIPNNIIDSTSLVEVTTRR